MPGLAQKNDQLSNATSSYYSLSSSSNGSVSSNGFWSKPRDGISYNQLQKFWNDLSPQARQNLLRIDKQTLFEQARKNMYCSRCNGLLLEGFLQIVMYGKSIQQEGASGHLPCNRLGIKDQVNDGQNLTTLCEEETQDPSVHPWGGLITTRDGALTLLDCYLHATSLKALQNVFDSARARERERELLYPDACGGSGRGWISQGMASYGRGHGARDTCALHTARLSSDTLVDFWSALGEETRQSLLRMKEEDFIERLMYRFDSKRFCRDCRRNVIREFKELKELKRRRREPRCTSWFCVADTAFQYEVSNDTIHADWHQTFIDSVGIYHHFEWAVGTGEGKSDILEFENVGMKGSVQVNGLDLGGLSACHITLRAWKLDGHCTEFSVKAHAMKGQPCVHCRLIVGDGYVTITRGESIRRFFEHAEEAEEEEDDDSMDKDGNELDGECSRPQKHAKSPELAREFLLDAATVIFKEQVEKAFREGTARQNAHSNFVCLALNLLEDRVHVACKEIITLEKQMKLLEEEEKEKREEEERKERKRTKEREKKLRRKERLRGKEKDKKCFEITKTCVYGQKVSSLCVNEEANNNIEGSFCENGDAKISGPYSPDVQDEVASNDCTASEPQNSSFDEELADVADSIENPKLSCQKSKINIDKQADSFVNAPDRRRNTDNGAVIYKSESRRYANGSEISSRGLDGSNWQSRSNATKSNPGNCGPRFSQKLQSSNIRMTERNNSHSCGCNQQLGKATRFSRETRSVNKLDSVPDTSRSVHRVNKLNQMDQIPDIGGRTKSKLASYTNSSGRDLLHTKKVWEPVEPQKRYPRSNSDSDITLRSRASNAEGTNPDKPTLELCSDDVSEKSFSDAHLDSTSSKGLNHPKDPADEEVDLHLTRSCNYNGTSDFSASSSSSSDNFSSEGDSNATSPNHLNITSTSDSEDSSQNGFSEGHNVGKDKIQSGKVKEIAYKTTSEYTKSFPPRDPPLKLSMQHSENGNILSGAKSLHQGAIPQIHNPNIPYPVFQPPTMGFYHQNPVPWSTMPANGFMTYPQPDHYIFNNPLSYGLSRDSHFYMQYGAMQHLATPFPSQVPVYHPVHRPNNGLNLQEPSNTPISGGLREREKAVPPMHHPSEVPPAAKTEGGNTGFSLFKFGGPVALPTFKANTQNSDEKTGEELSSGLSSDNVDGEHACSKQESKMEEYNLFAASNGIRFSIF